MEPLLIAAFGFLSADAKLLLADTSTDPTKLTRAACGAKVVAIRYLKAQPKGPKDTGRRTARNFSESPGQLFEVTEKLAPSDDTCLLGPAALKVTPVKPDGKTACDAKTAGALPKKPEKCTVLGTFGLGRVVQAVFPREGEQVVAALAVFDGTGRPKVRLFPAQWHAEKVSCWRADDGCELQPDAWKVPFVAGTSVLLLWSGAEGQNAELLRAKGLDLEPELSGSRYWSPE